MERRGHKRRDERERSGAGRAVAAARAAAAAAAAFVLARLALLSRTWTRMAGCGRVVRAGVVVSLGRASQRLL